MTPVRWQESHGGVKYLFKINAYTYICLVPFGGLRGVNSREMKGIHAYIKITFFKSHTKSFIYAYFISVNTYTLIDNIMYILLLVIIQVHYKYNQSLC